MAKDNRAGQAAIWSSDVIRKLRSRLKSPKQRLIFEISLWTGERMGAITQIKVADIYGSDGKVKEFITFRGSSRKSSKHGEAATRQVKIHPELRFHLERYQPPANGYLFPSRAKCGHITRRGVDDYWRKHLNDLGYSGFSTHSSRRWVINQLRKIGVEIVTIAETMGMNINTVRHYLDNDPDACNSAIASLSI